MDSFFPFRDCLRMLVLLGTVVLGYIYYQYMLYLHLKVEDQFSLLTLRKKMAEPSCSYSLEDISAEFDCNSIEESDSSELAESSDEDDYSSSDLDDEIILDELIPDAPPEPDKEGWIPVLEDE